MSTYLIPGVVGQSLETIAQNAAVGGALQTSTNTIELQINQAATLVTDAGTTRAASREEVLLLLEIFKEFITRMNWPYASS